MTHSADEPRAGDDTDLIPTTRVAAAPVDGATERLPAHPAAVLPDGEHPDGDDLFESGWDRPRRTSPLTAVLVAVLVAAVAFGLGVTVQKGHDSGLVGGARARGGPAAAAQQGGPGAQSGPSGQGGRSGGQDAAGPPVVVGTVSAVSGTTFTVTDLAGTAVKVTVAATATVTTTGSARLADGASVSVSGTKNPDGTVTATAVTSRRPAGNGTG